MNSSSVTSAEKINGISKKLSSFILPLLLGAAIMSSIIYGYRPSETFNLTALSVLFETAVFLLLDRLYNMKHKKIGGAICFLTLAAAVYIMGGLIRDGYMQSRIMFNRWFYASTEHVELYLYALIFCGGYLFYAALYYFTQVRYRGLFTLLLVLFPFAIYAKRLDVMPSRYLALILFSYLLVMAHNRQTAADSGITVLPDASYLTSIITFAAAVTLVLFVTPSPEVKSIQEKDSSAFDNLSIFGNEAPIQATDLLRSSSRDHGIMPTGQELFYVNTSEDMLYLKVQSFSYFADNAWYYGDDIIEEADYVWTNPEATVPGLAITTKLDILEEYCKYTEDDERLALIDLMRQNLELSGIVTIAEDGYNFKYLPLPEGTVSTGLGISYVDFPMDEEMQETYFGYGGNIYCNGEWETESAFEQFMAEYYSNYLIRAFSAELGLTTEDWNRIMDWYSEYGDDWQLYKNANSDRHYAQLVDGGQYDEFDERIRQLAFEITKGCETDYEKAAALESYFTQQGFIYDLTYIPDDESIEYFLFESKRGICSDFATAMTLMARSVGLTARYCEGFIAFEAVPFDQVRANLVNSGLSLSRPRGWDGFGQNWFVVRDSYAHAFVEVYLPACGWVVFEPTVPSFTDIMMGSAIEAEDDGGAGIAAIISQRSFYVSVGIAVLAAIMVIIFFRPISEAVFRVYVMRIDRGRALKKVYKRVVRRISRKTDTDLTAFTANQVCDLAMIFDMEINILVSAFESSFYGGKDIQDSDFMAAFEQYKQAYKVKLKPKREAALPDQAAV